MLDRRDFLVRTALATVAVVLGVFRTGAKSIAPTQGAPIAPTQATPIAADVSGLVLMIDGWSAQDDSAAGDQVWIGIDRSWRTAWR